MLWSVLVVVGILGLVSVSAAYLVGKRLGVPHYSGPRSDHFDGQKFRNYILVISERRVNAAVTRITEKISKKEKNSKNQF